MFSRPVADGNSTEARALRLGGVGGKAALELAANPELCPQIIAPLKMQRVKNSSELGIEIATKMTCIPRGQWEVRLKIYSLIKRLFEEYGIEFARPTVIVSEAASEKVAVARAAVAKRSRTKP